KVALRLTSASERMAKPGMVLAEALESRSTSDARGGEELAGLLLLLLEVGDGEQCPRRQQGGHGRLQPVVPSVRMTGRKRSLAHGGKRPAGGRGPPCCLNASCRRVQAEYTKRARTKEAGRRLTILGSTCTVRMHIRTCEGR